MKKLNQLLLKAFIGPFIATFFISIFLFLMQFLWKYVDDLIGKGLEWYVIAELLVYSSASLIPMALPLAVLLSSIMTFGALGEHYELVAIKSAGIPLRKTMKPLFIAMIGLSILAFFVSNIIIPKANLKGGALLYDVRQKKPAVNIKEGVFYNDIDGYSIKVGKKEADNQTIRNVLIYEHPPGKGNVNVLMAEHGKMVLSEDKRYLIFSLFNGVRYQEMVDNPDYRKTMPHNIMKFESQKIIFDLAQFTLSRTKEELFREDYRMLNVAELSKGIDSLKLVLDEKIALIGQYIRPYYHLPDSSFNLVPKTEEKLARAEILDNYNEDYRLSILTNAKNNARVVKDILHNSIDEFKRQRKLLIKHEIELHRKFTLSIACIILFFIGAPLGAIIRKGGLGLPMVVSVFFFIIYYIMNMTGEKMAKEALISVPTGIWFSTAVLLPLGIFLSWKASTESTLFDMDAYRKFFRRFKKKAKTS